MIDSTNANTPASRRKLLLATGGALLAATLILLIVVLPAEYGRDPTGLGDLLGLKAMGQLKSNSALAASGLAHSHKQKARSARIEIAVKPREELEYKAQLEKGEPLLYTWTVQGATVHYEFHGEPTQGEWPKGYFQSYETGDGSAGQSGSFVAPFTGRHGWYWRNESTEPAVIVLETNGYYSKLSRIDTARAVVE
jgi:hypothetical protein